MLAQEEVVHTVFGVAFVNLVCEQWEQHLLAPPRYPGLVYHAANVL